MSAKSGSMHICSRNSTAKSQLKGDDWPVNSVSFSPNGARVASSFHSHMIVVWRTQVNIMVSGVLCGHWDDVRSAKPSTNGKHLVSGSYDKTVSIRSCYYRSDETGTGKCT
jgi:WD40 repeat protein